MNRLTRCSSRRGPARSPSFVTWPASIVATPSRFAISISCEATSRSCATEPAAELCSSVTHVCTESTTTSAYGQRLMCSWRGVLH
eukprot:SAG25_NODE_1138_length_3816_cov_4.312887_4_plen_85_part_00